MKGEPTAVQLQAWRVFLRAHASVTRRLEADLLGAHRMALATYDVLVQLAEAPGGRLRMSELAGAVLLSRSGLTRLVDRLERERLVARESCPSDARGTFTVLTEEGRRRLRDAAPTHLDGVRRYVTGQFSDAELATLETLLARLVRPTGPPPEMRCDA